MRTVVVVIVERRKFPPVAHVAGVDALSGKMCMQLGGVDVDAVSWESLEQGYV